MEKNIPTTTELENFFINNETLLLLEKRINRFNPIKVMKMEHMEIRHSAILGWLLDPQESHGLEDKFLKDFLCCAFKNHQNAEIKVTALEILQTDLRDSEIRIEKQHVDILILNQKMNWAFIIENKFHSKQHGEQLKLYREKIQNTFDNFKIFGVFLTLHEETPKDSSFVHLYYSDVIELLESIQRINSNMIHNEINIFIKQYIEVLKEANFMSHDTQNIARELYRNHKKVINYIIEHGANTDFALAVESVFGKEIEELTDVIINNFSFRYSWSNNTTVSFIPSSWAETLDKVQYEWPGCEDWWAGFPLICWLDINEDKDKQNGTIQLYAEVGPSEDYKFRSGLIAAIEGVATKKIRFQNTAKNEGKKYSKFFKNNIKNITDIHDVDQIEDAIRSLLIDFHEEFDAVSKGLKKLFKL